MKKTLYSYITITALFLSFGANAQFNYDLAVLNDTYQPLTTGSISLNNSQRWDDTLLEIPIGFQFVMDGDTVDTVYVEDDNLILAYKNDTASGFFFTDADIHDRGYAGGSTSRSPLRYRVTGSAGSRILKFEIANAGFYDEFDLYTTDNDSIYLQIWLYEGTNIIEFHFGPSNITHYSDYFYITGQPLFGYVKKLDPMYNMENLYYYNGTYSAPTLDSTADPNNLSSGGLNVYPQNGTVYKFTPKNVGVNTLRKMLSGIKIDNNITSDIIKLSNNNDQKLSYRVVTLNGSNTSCIGTLANGSNTIDISSLPAGAYLLNINGDAGSASYRVVRQ